MLGSAYSSIPAFPSNHRDRWSIDGFTSVAAPPNELCSSARDKAGRDLTDKRSTVPFRSVRYNLYMVLYIQVR